MRMLMCGWENAVYNGKQKVAIGGEKDEGRSQFSIRQKLINRRPRWRWQIRAIFLNVQASNLRNSKLELQWHAPEAVQVSTGGAR